jgi:transposase
MKFTINDLKRSFPNQDVCLEYIFQYRFGNHFPCPKCGNTSWYRIKKRKAYACTNGHQINPLAGTIFHKSEIDLTMWFFAIYKFSNSRNGVAAKELERDLGVTYKTAWRMAKQIRSLMEMSGLKLSGIVEVDEAFMEKVKNPQDRKSVPKILGMVQRKGAAKAVVIRKSGDMTTIPLVKSEIEAGSSLMTDGAAMFRGRQFPDYKINSVNHSKKEFAFGGVHTNSVEGFFSQIKRSIDGTYHRVSATYLQSYLDEFSWRLTNVRTGIPLFLLLLDRLCQWRGVKAEESLPF